MGLFDYIRCRMPLPANPAPPHIEWFQTKDMQEPYMDRYTIEADGRLILHEVFRERVEDPKAVLGWYMKPVSQRDVDVPYHGDISFAEYDTKTKEHWRYIARFTENRCDRIWLSEHRPSQGLTEGRERV